MIPYLPAWIRVLYNCTVKSVLDQNVIDAIMYQHTVQLTPYYNVTVSFVSTAGTQIPVLPKNLNNCWRGERAASSGERRRAGVREKTCALPAHPVHAHPSSRSSHKPSDVVRPTESRCRFCAGHMSTYEAGEAVGISKQAGRPGRAAYRPGRVLRVLPQPNASGYDYEVCPSVYPSAIRR